MTLDDVQLDLLYEAMSIFIIASGGLLAVGLLMIGVARLAYRSPIDWSDPS
jgi:hypothetical protein